MPIEPTVFFSPPHPPPLRIFATLENSRHPPPLRMKIFSFTDSRPIDHFSKSAGFSKSLTVFSFVCFAQGQKKKFSIRIKSVSRISFDVPHVRFILKTILYILSLSFSIERKETSMIYIYIYIKRKQWKFFSEKNSTHKHRRFDDT